MNINDYDVLLVTDQSTGFGDNYGNLYSSLIGYKILKNIGLKIAVLFNSDRNFYFGLHKPNREFYENIFDFTEFGDDLFFYEEVPKNFKQYKNVETTYYIFIDENKYDEIAQRLNYDDFMGYTHHLVVRHRFNHKEEHFGLDLINKNLVSESKKISEKYKDFIGIHIRIPDGVSMDDNQKIRFQNRISEILDQNKDKKILVSGRGPVINYFDIDEDRIIDIKKEINRELSFYEYDIIEMCLYANSYLTFKYCQWDSAFLTYSVLLNLKIKKIEEIIQDI